MPAYNNYFPMQYQPPQAVPQYQPPSHGIVWVQGEAGAKSYLVGAGNSVILMDSEDSTFYIKSTDASGMPLPLRIFDYTERKQDAPTNTPLSQENATESALSGRMEELDEHIHSLDERMANLDKRVHELAKKNKKERNDG